jgi:trans-2-enoyl-CoA reductase
MDVSFTTRLELAFGPGKKKIGLSLEGPSSTYDTGMGC